MTEIFLLTTWDEFYWKNVCILIQIKPRFFLRFNWQLITIYAGNGSVPIKRHSMTLTTGDYRCLLRTNIMYWWTCTQLGHFSAVRALEFGSSFSGLSQWFFLGILINSISSFISSFFEFRGKYVTTCQISLEFFHDDTSSSNPKHSSVINMGRSAMLIRLFPLSSTYWA